jgi:hypothetical protein
MDLYVHGRVRSRVEVAAAIAAVDAERVRAEFARMLSTPVSVALAGKVAAGATDKAKAAFAALRR